MSTTGWVVLAVVVIVGLAVVWGLCLRGVARVSLRFVEMLRRLIVMRLRCGNGRPSRRGWRPRSRLYEPNESGLRLRRRRPRPTWSGRGPKNIRRLPIRSIQTWSSQLVRRPMLRRLSAARARKTSRASTPVWITVRIVLGAACLSSSTIDVSPRQVEIGEAPSRVVLDVPFRVIAKVLVSVLVFSIAVSLLDSVRTVLIWLGMAVFIAIALNPAVVRVERLMRRTWAVVTVFFTFVVGLLIVLALLAAPFVSQINDSQKRAPSGRATDPKPADPSPRSALQHRRQSRGPRRALPSVIFGAAGAVINRRWPGPLPSCFGGVRPVRIPRINRLVLSQLRRAGAHVPARSAARQPKRGRRPPEPAHLAHRGRPCYRDAPGS